MRKTIFPHKNPSIIFFIVFIVIIAVLSVFRIWIIKDREMVAITPTPHDMQLYITNAQSLVQGKWFGPYNERVIARGPIFPLLIAGAYLSHIPLGIANTICYVLASLLCIFLLYKKRTFTWIIIPLYALLLFNPFVLDHETSFEITRSTFYPALIVGVALTLLGLLVTIETSYKKALIFSILFGGVFFLFWYYREEGFFMLPLVGIGYGYSILQAWAHKKISKTYIALLCLPILLFLFFTHILSFINFTRYGIYTTREFSHPSYSSAFASLLRIYPDSGNPLIPITRHQRYILYQVSPSFAKLQSFFEGEGGENWAENGRIWTGIPKEEREISGGAFYFAVREAVWNMTSPSQSAEQNFFEQLTKEINIACKRKYIQCGVLPLSGFSLLKPNDRISFFNNFANTVQTGVGLRGFDISTNAKYSSGPKDQIDLFRTITNGIILTDNQPVPKLHPVVSATYSVITWWYHDIMPWLFLFTLIHYMYRILKRNSLTFYDWYQASLILSAVLFYIVVAIFGTLKSPTNTTAGSYTSGAYGLLLLFVVLEILAFTKNGNHNF